MNIEFYVEEPSMEAALLNLVPKVIGEGHYFRIHNMGDKKSLLKNLPNRLRGYAKWIPDDWRIIVLIDEDRQDCRRLKSKLENAAKAAGFATKSRKNGKGRFMVMNRIVVEELEAWFFGDVAALQAAYPGIRKSVEEKAGFRDPDAISGGTWEALERVLQGKGYHRGGLAKIAAARDISIHMNPDRNIPEASRYSSKA